MILDLCGGTGSWSKPYTDNGYDVRVLTLSDFDVTKWQECEWLKSAIKQNEIYIKLIYFSLFNVSFSIHL